MLKPAAYFGWYYLSSGTFISHPVISYRSIAFVYFLIHPSIHPSIVHLLIYPSFHPLSHRLASSPIKIDHSSRIQNCLPQPHSKTLCLDLRSLASLFTRAPTPPRVARISISTSTATSRLLIPILPTQHLQRNAFRLGYTKRSEYPRKHERCIDLQHVV